MINKNEYMEDTSLIEIPYQVFSNLQVYIY